MDVSAEAADVVVKESAQLAEQAAKLAGAGVKNVAALLAALASDNYKVVGQTTAKRLARDPSPAVVIAVKKEDRDTFQKLAKSFGILYFFAQKKGSDSDIINVVSTQNYAAQLNAIMEQMGYPIPERSQEVTASKKAVSRAPQERSSQGHGIGSTPSPTIAEGATEQKPSVKKRLQRLKQVADGMNETQTKIKKNIR